MLALILVAATLGIGNLAAAVSLGLNGVTNRLRLEVGLVFGILEGAMPAIGLFLGHTFAHSLGNVASPIGGSLLALLGSWNFLKEWRSKKAVQNVTSLVTASGENKSEPALLTKNTKNFFREGREQISTQAANPKRSISNLIFTGIILALDNLVVGFALGTYHISVAAAAITIGAVSGVMSLCGLEIGKFAGHKLGLYGEMTSSAVLVLVGIAIGLGYL